MNNEVRNFYDISAEYDNSIFIIKELINNIVSVKGEDLINKLELIDTEGNYLDFIDLLDAVIGRETNKYYYCETQDDVKYYGLEIGKVYETSKLNVELQSKINIKKQLKLQARSILAQKLIIISKELKELFSLNIDKGDGTLITLDSRVITENDVEYFSNLIKYLEILIDQTGRLKILDAERDVFALEKAKETYNKKSSLEKNFYKLFNKESKIIENMAKGKR